MTKTKQNWEELKKYLLAVHAEYTDRNGLDYCKNCGVDMKGLADKFDIILQAQRKEIFKELNEYVPEEECCEVCDIVSAEASGTGKLFPPK